MRTRKHGVLHVFGHGAAYCPCPAPDLGLIRPVACVLVSCCLLISGMASGQKKTFVRLYDAQHKKIATGKLVGSSDSTIRLLRYRMETELPVARVSLLRMRRSFGNSVLTGALVTGGIVGIVGAATAQPDAIIFGYTSVTGLGVGALLGGAVGALGGMIVGSARNRPVFEIDGSPEKWKKIRPFFDQ